MSQNVNENGTDLERVGVMRTLINEVVSDLDSTKPVATQNNIKKFMLHVAWHEGAFLRKRKQHPSGPGRSFFQFEPGKAKDAVVHATTLGLVGRLATAAGTTVAAIRDAAEELELGEPWPTGNLIESKLASIDLFGCYMARFALKRIEAPIPVGNSMHATYWADNWKVSFSTPSERSRQIAIFTDESDNVDDIMFGPSSISTQSMGIPQMATTSSLLQRFRWPAIVTSLSVVIATLPICPWKGSGLVESLFNTLAIGAASQFWQLAGWLFALTFVGSLIGPTLRRTWNTKLADYIVSLEDMGRSSEAQRFQKRAIDETKWFVIQLFVLLSLAGLAAFTATNTPFSKKSRMAVVENLSKAPMTERVLLTKNREPSLVALYPWRECGCGVASDNNAKLLTGKTAVAEQSTPSPDSASDKDSPEPNSTDDTSNTCASERAILLWNGNERFILAVLSCGVLMFFEWMFEYCAFLFVRRKE